MFLDEYSVLNIITGLVLFFSAFSIYLVSNRRLPVKLFSLFTFTVAVWCLLIAISTKQSDVEIILIKIDFLLGTLIASTFLLFAFSYSYPQKINRKTVLFFVLVEILFFYLLFYTDLILVDTIIIPHLDFFAWEFGKLQILFDIQFASFWMYGIYLLYKKSKEASSVDEKRSMIILVWSLIIGLIPPGIVTILLPQLGIYDYFWLGPASGLIWIVIIGYSIAKHHLFNIKVIGVELVVFSLWLFILMRAIFSENLEEMLIQGGLLIITIIFGILVIRSVLHEIRQREHIENLVSDLKKAYSSLRDLNDHLELKVAEQTVEIREAYAVEKMARVELEKLNETKDQFITSTQHHLRTPLTSLKWELESMKKGGSGFDLSKSIENMSSSIKNLSEIIENFIRITESGTKSERKDLK